MRIRSRLARSTAVFLAAGFLASCHGSDVDEGPPPPTEAPQTLEEALTQAPLTGTTSTPLQWDLSSVDVDDPDIELAVRIVQAYRALDYYRYATATPLEDIDLYSYLAIDRGVGTLDFWLSPNLELKDDPASGPVWIWVQDASWSDNGTEIMIVLCEDVGGGNKTPNKIFYQGASRPTRSST